MAEQLPPLPGSERIRAIQDADGQFKAFDSYPWAKDANFMVLLPQLLTNICHKPRTSTAPLPSSIHPQSVASLTCPVRPLRHPRRSQLGKSPRYPFRTSHPRPHLLLRSACRRHRRLCPVQRLACCESRPHIPRHPPRGLQGRRGSFRQRPRLAVLSTKSRPLRRQVLLRAQCLTWRQPTCLSHELR